MESGKKIVIIGAGPAGLTAAYKLAQAGCAVEVFEAGQTVGGLARSFELWGQIVDCGPHRYFSNDALVNGLFMEVIEKDYVNVNRLTRIYYDHKYYYYPISALNVLKNMDLISIVQILSSYLWQRLWPIPNPKTFEEWVVNKFGRKLFNIFFKNYSEKLWGIPCSQIDVDWAAQRIKQFSLGAAVQTILFGNRNKHKTLVDHFVYPTRGAGMLYQKMQAKTERHGGKIHLNTPVEKILTDSNNNACGVLLKNGTAVQADEVISTMPLTLMVKGLENVPAQVQKACDALFFRNTILVYVEIDSQNLFPDNWIYVHSNEVLLGRITNFRNWSPQLYGDKKSSILCLEYWCFDKDEIWQQDTPYFATLASKELKTLRIVTDEKSIINTHVTKLHRCYPVYETGYVQHVDVIKNHLDKIRNLRVIGRYGSFKYNNQDHSILMGLLAAKEITEGTHESLWDINTETDYHELGRALD